LRDRGRPREDVQFEIKLLKERAKVRDMPRLVSTMANKADPSASERSRPPTPDDILFCLRKPLERRPPYLTLLIGITCSSRRSSGTRGLGSFSFMDCEPIMELDAVDNRIKSSCLDTAETSAKLFHDLSITTVN
jgi:hypothetical protein